MKLNQSQIQALTEKIATELRAEKQSLLYTDENFLDGLPLEERSLYYELLDVVKSEEFIKLFDTLKSGYYIKDAAYYEDQLTLQFVNNANKDKNAIVNTNSIKSAIILKTIDCDSLEDLIKSVKEELK
jgi:hypothetical protein